MSDITWKEWARQTLSLFEKEAVLELAERKAKQSSSRDELLTEVKRLVRQIPGTDYTLAYTLSVQACDLIEELRKTNE